MAQGKGKAPKLQVEMTDESRTGQDVADAAFGVPTAGADAAADASARPAAEAAASSAAASRTERIGSWCARTFAGHEHAAIGAALGLLAALLIFVVGVGKTLVVAVLVLVGVTFGQCLDGDPKIINYLRRLVEKYRSE